MKSHYGVVALALLLVGGESYANWFSSSKTPKQESKVNKGSPKKPYGKNLAEQEVTDASAELAGLMGALGKEGAPGNYLPLFLKFQQKMVTLQASLPMKGNEGNKEAIAAALRALEHAIKKPSSDLSPDKLGMAYQGLAFKTSDSKRVTAMKIALRNALKSCYESFGFGEIAAK
ncbi:MAG: hypothetical protein M1549_01670 [Candidatus Dependentiae bacterium]|nr:hypothetical protein [Candidatus Dependentiae bacterium]